MKTKVIAVCVFFAAISSAQSLPIYTVPDRLQWVQRPHAYVSDAITMSVAKPNDDAGISYRFVCISGGGPSSAWQTGMNYGVTGLSPETSYTYVAYARDSADQQIGLPTTEITVMTRATSSSVGHTAAIDQALQNGSLELIDLMVNGNKDNRVNIATVNRWILGSSNPYNSSSMRSEFIADCQHILEAFDINGSEPFAPFIQYKSFFNYYGIWWPDMPYWDPNDRVNGMHYADYQEIRARTFLPWHTDYGWISLMTMLNGSGGGGGAGLNLTDRVGDAYIVGNDIKGYLHEFSHTAPNISDEYTALGFWGNGNEARNVTSDYRRDLMKWRAWIDPETPVPTPFSKKYVDKIGAFEGGQGRATFCYRPSCNDCIMGAGSFANDYTQLCDVCKQILVLRLYECVNPIDKRVPAVDSFSVPEPCRVQFSVSRVKPDPDTQKTEWRVNGLTVAENTDSVSVDIDELSSYEVSFHLVDETPFVRPDPPYTKYPEASVTWVVANPNPTSSADPLSLDVTAVKPLYEDIDNGRITVHAIGGVQPYIYLWDDGVEGAVRENLPPGVYTVRVVDSEHRNIIQPVDLTVSSRLPVQLVSEYSGGNWTVSCPEAQSNSQLSLLWSNASTDWQTQVSGGVVTCQITHDEGTVAVLQLDLQAPGSPFSVSVQEQGVSSNNENSGYVLFGVTGGRAPYRFAWFDGLVNYDSRRDNMRPGSYSVTVQDGNGTSQTLNITIGSDTGFVLSGLVFEKAGPGSIRISNPDSAYDYLWYAEDYPEDIPRYPHGLYFGTCTASSGASFNTDAYVIQNKAGVDIVDTASNNYGYWIYLKLYLNGNDENPVIVTGGLTQNGENYTFGGTGTDSVYYSGTVSGGNVSGSGGGTSFVVYFNSKPENPPGPIAVGNELAVPRDGNYYVAARKKTNGAVSFNRIGVAVARKIMDRPAEKSPDQITASNLKLWMDASDLDGNGQTDTGILTRRGGVNKWQDRATDNDFRSFAFYHPNQQNGMGAAGWDTIWIQGMRDQVLGARTIFMVRREHDMSRSGTAPFRELNNYIGIGEYGDKLFSSTAANNIGSAYVNGESIDPHTFPMPDSFYIGTYVFNDSRSLKTSEGFWEGSVAEVIVYDGVLSTADRQAVESYLWNKWMAEVELDSSLTTAVQLSDTTTEDGGTAQFSIVLNEQPSSSVTVPLVCSHPDEAGLSTTSLTFTTGNWNTPQTVTVTGQNDNRADGDIAYTVLAGLMSSSDGRFNGQSVALYEFINEDNDISGFDLSAVSGNTDEDGKTATLTLKLTSEPLGDVSVAFSSSDTTEGTVTPGILTFSPFNWSVSQTVTITGVDDFVNDGDITYTIITGNAISIDPKYNNRIISDVTVVNEDDNDMQTIQPADLVGHYTRHPAQNTYHEVDITFDGNGLTWRNAANVSWSLTLISNDLLRTGPECPYGVRDCPIVTEDDGNGGLRVTGIYFLNELYSFADTTPPNPDPMTWASAPAVVKADPLGILTTETLAGNNPATGALWAVGDTYRLVFVTSGTRDAASNDITDYNAFVQAAANAAGLGNATWKVIGSTDAVDAQDNTATNPAENGTGEAIFLLDGSTVVANNYADLWDGSIDAPIDMDENGTTGISVSVATGSYANGTKVDRHLGGSDEVPPKIEYGDSSRTTTYWTRIFNGSPSGSYPFYALSDPITISGESNPRITMTASAASDPSGVEYYFTETSGNPGGDDSGWQSSPVYIDTGLTSGLTYTYTVTARDLSPAQNTTAPSAPASAVPEIPLAGYDAWAAANSVGVATADDDGDGRDNLLEYALDGDPNSAGDLDVDPVLTRITDAFEYSFKQRNDDPNLTYTVEICTDLIANFWTNSGTTGVNGGTTGAFDQMIHTIPADQMQSYIRLKIMNQ